MINFNKAVYPAFIKLDEEGMFGVYFPTLFPESGWEYPLAKGKTKRRAIQNAKEELAYTLAGILYDNESLPHPTPIKCHHLSEGMEAIEVETSFEPYAEEIEEHLKGRHWHLNYYDEAHDDFYEAIGFKNENGTWDIYFEDYAGDNTDCDSLLFTAKTPTEAEEKFNHYVKNVILKRKKD